MGTTISFNRPDGKKLHGYLADPNGGADAPGIVVIQEWWGVNEQIRGVAENMAGLYGDLQGIAGRTLQEIDGLEVPLLDGPAAGEAAE